MRLQFKSEPGQSDGSGSSQIPRLRNPSWEDRLVKLVGKAGWDDWLGGLVVKTGW